MKNLHLPSFSRLAALALVAFCLTATPALAQQNGGDVANPTATPNDGVGVVIVVTNVVNNDGGILTDGNFQYTVSGNNAPSTVFAGASSGTVLSLDPGPYSVNPINVGGYQISPVFECSGTIAAGQTNLCILNVNDVPGSVLGEGTNLPLGMPQTGADDADPFSSVVLWVFLSFIVSAAILSLFEGAREA